MKEHTYCLHLAAFGCEQCKGAVESEIKKERERCAKLVEDLAGAYISEEIKCALGMAKTLIKTGR